MVQKEFSLRECYILACYGLRTVINAGRLEGFTKEEDGEVQECREGGQWIEKNCFERL